MAVCVHMMGIMQRVAITARVMRPWSSVRWAVVSRRSVLAVVGGLMGRMGVAVSRPAKRAPIGSWVRAVR